MPARHDAPPGPRPAPAAQRLIVRYAKRGRLRFASHRDIARAIERGVRKAGLPVALSAGFTPHPKISYAGAAPTGTASEAEYLELALTQVCDPARVRDQLDAALPDGIDVIDVMDGRVPLADLRLEASEWQVVLPGVGPDDASRAIRDFLALPSAEVERLTSKGRRTVDARGPVTEMAADRCAGGDGSHGNAILRMVVRHVIPAVRPDDILTALGRETGLAPVSPPLVTRLAQGPADEMTVRPPAGSALPDRGQGAAPEQGKTTRTQPAAAVEAAGPSVSAYDQLPRGAEPPARVPAPGSLTGDHPDARERAEQRIQQ